jgi:hypothetical protein
MKAIAAARARRLRANTPAQYAASRAYHAQNRQRHVPGVQGAARRVVDGSTRMERNLLPAADGAFYVMMNVKKLIGKKKDGRFSTVLHLCGKTVEFEKFSRPRAGVLSPQLLPPDLALSKENILEASADPRVCGKPGLTRFYTDLLGFPQRPYPQN